MNVFSFLIQILIYSLLPLLGIFFWGWDWREIIILYWLENITIGVATAIGMIRSSRAPQGKHPQHTNSAMHADKILGRYFIVAFFAVHYGMFTLIHGVFLSLLVSGVFISQAMPAIDVGPSLLFWMIASVVQIAAILMRPAPTASLKRQMSTPYKRVVPLHLTLILGAFAATLFNAPASALSILVAVKLVVDIAHFKSLRATRA